MYMTFALFHNQTALLDTVLKSTSIQFHITKMQLGIYMKNAKNVWFAIFPVYHDNILPVYQILQYMVML